MTGYEHCCTPMQNRRTTMLCSDVMKKNVECMKETDTAQAAAQRMREKSIGFIPICDDSRKLVGMVTDRDLTVRVLADAGAANTQLKQVMSKDILTCGPNDDLKQAQSRMGQRQKS